jgi:hypothetical protein
MKTERLVMWVTFLAIGIMAAQMLVDNDTWWHLRAGEWILEHRAVPRTDEFSSTRAGAEWHYPGWLAEAPMALLYRLGGPGALNLWAAGMVALAFIVLWPALSGGPFVRAFVLVLAAAASGVYWAARPYLVTFLLTAVFLRVMDGAGRGRERRLWLLPLLMAVWANSHGGFLAGFLVWGAYWAGEMGRWGVAYLVWRRNRAQGADRPVFPRALTWLGLALAAAACLNPYGAEMLLYPFKTVSIGALKDFIQEWQSPDFHNPQFQPFAWLLLLGVGVLGASRRRLALHDFLLFAGFAYLGLSAGRNVALFALAAPLVITRHAAPLEADAQRWVSVYLHPRPSPPLAPRLQALVNWTLLVLLGLALLLRLAQALPAQANEKAFAQTLPVGAVRYLEQARPPGRLFNSYNWGGYLLWALPEYPVFVDGRTDLYDDEIIDQWLQVVTAREGWQAVLDRRQVRLVLVEPGTALAAVLPAAGWKLLYQDGVAVVYGR